MRNLGCFISLWEWIGLFIRDGRSLHAPVTGQVFGLVPVPCVCYVVRFSSCKRNYIYTNCHHNTHTGLIHVIRNVARLAMYKAFDEKVKTWDERMSLRAHFSRGHIRVVCRSVAGMPRAILLLSRRCFPRLPCLLDHHRVVGVPQIGGFAARHIFLVSVVTCGAQVVVTV